MKQHKNVQRPNIKNHSAYVAADSKISSGVAVGLNESIIYPKISEKRGMAIPLPAAVILPIIIRTYIFINRDIKIPFILTWKKIKALRMIQFYLFH